MRATLLVILGALLSVHAQAQTVPAPRVSANDTWTYQNTVENKTGWHQADIESTVEHASASSIAISNKQAGSTNPPREMLVGGDWSRSRSVNGHQTVVNRPLNFPLSVGKTWEVDYTEDHPNRVHTSEHWHTVFKVTGWEDITVPAGTFHALKIEGDGEWSAAIAPAVGNASGTRLDAQGTTTVMQTTRTAPSTVSGRLYKAFWYAPSVKKWVKSVEEYYGPNDVRSERYMDELKSFKVAG